MLLIYRGFTYHKQLASIEPLTVEVVTTQILFYRGMTYLRQLPALRPPRPAKAVNWRFNMPGTPHDRQLKPASL